MFSGETVIPIATSRVGEKYVLGARVVLTNKEHHGPWDCAEFISWCVYQAYRVVMGVKPADPQKGDAYTGYWWRDATEAGAKVDVQAAIATPGAILLRRPDTPVAGGHLIGHIALSLGDGRTVEARGAKYGVQIVPNAAKRLWTTGVTVPGVLYAAKSIVAYAAPAEILYQASPFMRGPHVLAIQRALVAAGISVGPIDGVFGPMTEAAVVNLQLLHGLTPDGAVGPDTAAALGLAWPIVASLADESAWQGTQKPTAVPLAAKAA